ncbi:MAG: hypothetical protein JOZ80_06685 [Acidobacteriaceae bacterium]|nr:hypothetical protein [Acidobacteriaceae bacterium]
MRSVITIPLASFFVFLAGFNVWVMLSGRTAGLNGHRWMLLHRIAGYTFITIFAVLSFFMLLRLKGMPDELSPRLTLHAGLALLLVPLLFTKVVLVRSRKAPWAALIALGVSIFATGFTLVAMNISVHYLRNASPHKLPTWISKAVVIAICLLAARAVLALRAQTNPLSRSQHI